MTLLRTTARTLLASYFVVHGVKAVRNPDPLVPVAQPVTDKVVPLLKQYAPAQVAGYVPEDTASLVRVNGAAQLLGGVALASGKGRRLGAALLAASLVPTTLAKHPFWQEVDTEAKAAERNQFLKNGSLLGGVLLAAADTEGKPSLAWRAQKGTKQLTRGTSSLAKDTQHAAELALAEGATLVGAVVKQSRKTRKQAAKQAKKTRKEAGALAAAASAAAAKQLAEAKKNRAKAAKRREKRAKNIQRGEN
ncbi:MAG: DoxX family membrane protein [Actinomycetes bacterium]